MNILLVGRHHGRARMLVPGKQAVCAVVIALAGAVGGAAWGGYQLALLQVAEGDAETKSHLVNRWRTRLVETRERLADVEERAEHEIDALTQRLGELQARALRVDALGQNLVAAADMGDQEFNFDSSPAMGGPEAELSDESQSVADLEGQIDALDSRLRSREKQLAVLDRLIANREINSQRELDGRPVSWGWTSSPYGYRTDPFTGRRAWHTRVDVAGRDGGDVVAVGAGVVTEARQKGGYGYFVEVDHGDGLQTRYAHAKELLVGKGDIVEKGQKIAVMGSTGRSTGPHVHFEVVRNGNRQDPKETSCSRTGPPGPALPSPLAGSLSAVAFIRRSISVRMLCFKVSRICRETNPPCRTPASVIRRRASMEMNGLLCLHSWQRAYSVAKCP